MYTVGRYDGRMPSYDNHRYINEHSGDNPFDNHPGGVTFPIPISMGPLNDVSYVVKGGSDDSNSFLFINRDGRGWTSGYDGGYAGRGLGRYTANPDDFFRRNQTLPFEVYFQDYSPVLLRVQEKINMAQSVNEGSSTGFFLVTDNQRVIGTQNNSWYYGFDVVMPSQRSGGYIGGYSRFNY